MKIVFHHDDNKLRSTSLVYCTPTTSRNYVGCDGSVKIRFFFAVRFKYLYKYITLVIYVYLSTHILGINMKYVYV